MEYYDFRHKTWTSLCDVQNWRSCTSMVSHGTCIYFIGGEETDSDSPTGSRTVNRVTRYDCEKKQWISVPSMQLARRWAGSIVIDNKIYVIGEYEQKIRLSINQIQLRLVSQLLLWHDSRKPHKLQDIIYKVLRASRSNICRIFFTLQKFCLPF